jgi:hypothetical protein
METRQVEHFDNAGYQKNRNMRWDIKLNSTISENMDMNWEVGEWNSRISENRNVK